MADLYLKKYQDCSSNVVGSTITHYVLWCQVFPLEAYQPRAVIVDELSAGSQYAVYVGGVAPKGPVAWFVNIWPAPLM